MPQAKRATTRLCFMLTLCVLALAACERKKAPEHAPVKTSAAPVLSAGVLPAKVLNISVKATPCGQRCAGFSADWLDFPAQPALNTEMLKAISSSISPGPKPEPTLASTPISKPSTTQTTTPVPSSIAASAAKLQVTTASATATEVSLRQIAKSLLADAKEAGEAWEQTAKAVQRPGLNNVTVIDIDNYTYTGGAHGMTTVAYVNWDRQLARVVHLDDMLLAGQKPAFYAELKRAHTAWVKQHDDAISIEAGWPFDKSDNVALLPDALVVKYQPYSIGPFSEGTPELVIPYAHLKTVLKPEYLPKP